MQIQALHKKFYQIQRIDESEYSPEAYERFDRIKLLFKLREEGCSEKTALEAIKTSRSTFYRWLKNYQIFNLRGLENQSKRPNNTRKPVIAAKMVDLVISTRAKYPLWGKKKIAVMIKREHGITISESTVGRIIKKYIDKGKLKPVCHYYGKKETRRRLFNGHAQRLKAGMKAEKPGQLIQIDHMDVKIINGVPLKHFQAVCPITKIAVKQAYKRATSSTASDFLELVKQKMPFDVVSIQVDGGSEFMGEFEQACKQSAIELYVLPPRSPEYNGHVERCNATAKYEFYYQYDGPLEFIAVQKKLQEFVKTYNNIRPHQGISYLTPFEYFAQLKERPLLSHML